MTRSFSPSNAPGGAGGTSGASARTVSAATPLALSPDAELMRFGYEPSLRRNLSLASLIVYGLLFFVPMAPVAVFGFVTNRSGGVPVLVYLFAALVMGASAWSYREMALRYPTAGSVYGYVRGATNPFFGFFAGWFLLLDYLLMPALLTILAAVSLGHSFAAIPTWAIIALFMLLSWAMNMAGMQITTAIGFILLAIQLLVSGYFVITVLGKVFTGELAFTAVALWRPEMNMAGVLTALSIAALSFLGFDAIATLNEESRDGGRGVGKATVILLVLITVLFIVQIWAASIVSPQASFEPGTATSRAFYHAVDAVMPTWYSPIFTLTNAVVAIFSCLVVAHASSSRLLFAMARDRILPQKISATNSRGIPVVATTVVALLSLTVALAFSEHTEVMTSVVTFGALIGYLFLHVAVIRKLWWREKSGQWLAHLVVPIAGSIGLIFVIVNYSTHTKIVGAIWFAIGAILTGVYLLVTRAKRGETSPEHH